MADSGSYDVRRAHRSVDAELRRLASQARSGWEKEARALLWFGVRDGQRVIELGSGPGFITQQLLELLPTSHITCLDRDPTLLERAQELLLPLAADRLQFVEGSVAAMPLEANQFDVAYARLLFQHLPDPRAALAEIWRVLKPGGKLIILDIDDGLFGVFEPDLPEFAPILAAFGQAQAERGGNRAIGRQLWPIMHAAGFRNGEVEALASHSAERGIATFLQHIDPERLQTLVQEGRVAAEDFERYREALARFAAAPQAYTLWLSLLVCGEKPHDAGG